MKLLHCTDCHDVVKLAREITFCNCGASQGWYHEDGLHASFRGDSAVLLGITNSSLVHALKNQTNYPGGSGRVPGSEGWSMTAFVIPESSPNTTRLKSKEEGS